MKFVGKDRFQGHCRDGRAACYDYHRLLINCKMPQWLLLRRHDLLFSFGAYRLLLAAVMGTWPSSTFSAFFRCFLVLFFETCWPSFSSSRFRGFAFQYSVLRCRNCSTNVSLRRSRVCTLTEFGFVRFVWILASNIPLMRLRLTCTLYSWMRSLSFRCWRA